MRVGFIGLGSQGGGMADAILASGHELHVWARRPEALAPFVDAGATAEPSFASLAAACELMCICVTAEKDVADILVDRGLLTSMRPGAILALHSTISPDACRAFGTKAARAGIEFLDAPVSGGGDAARQRKLLVMLGGASAVITRARPVLECFGDRLVHVGGIGAGQTAKIVNNLLFLANFGAALQALDLGRALGMDAAALRAALTGGSGSSRALEAVDHLTSPQMAAEIAPIVTKDLALANDLARTRAFDIATLDHAGRVALAGLSDILAQR